MLSEDKNYNPDILNSVALVHHSYKLYRGLLSLFYVGTLKYIAQKCLDTIKDDMCACLCYP